MHFNFMPFKDFHNSYLVDYKLPLDISVFRTKFDIHLHLCVSDLKALQNDVII